MASMLRLRKCIFTAVTGERLYGLYAKTSRLIMRTQLKSTVNQSKTMIVSCTKLDIVVFPVNMGVVPDMLRL